MNARIERNPYKRMTKEIIDRNSADVTEKNLALMAWVLWHDFGFGKKRLTAVLNQFYLRAVEFQNNDTWADEVQCVLEKVTGAEWTGTGGKMENGTGRIMHQERGTHNGPDRKKAGRNN